MNIELSKLEQLVDGEITLDEFVQGTSNSIDDTVLASAKLAIGLLAGNKHLLNMACDYLNLPITFTQSPNDDGRLLADGEVPDELATIDGIADLRAIVLDCKS